jgi:hypothetical protein
MDTPIRESPIKDRCDLAIRQAEQSYCCRDLFLMALGCDSIPGTAIFYRSWNGQTLLHAVAGAIGKLAASGNRLFGTEETQRRMLGWGSIIQELVAGGADLHANSPIFYLRYIIKYFSDGKEYDRATPLVSMFASALSVWIIRWAYPRTDLGKAMTIYITALYNSGVNLEEYGVRESMTWKPLEFHEGLVEAPRDYDYSDYYFGRRRLLSFNYGPYPEDWRIWENEPTDEFAGDFWLMIDRKEEVMPGTWIE